jgi:hypothetical protein
MSVGGSIETVGENKEFTIAVSDLSDVTIYFYGGSSGTKTSADDTATEKYFDNYGAVKSFVFRPNQTIQIVSINGIEFTSPITVFINTVYAEKLDSAVLTQMVIRPTVLNTHIRLRVRGR